VKTENRIKFPNRFNHQITEDVSYATVVHKHLAKCLSVVPRSQPAVSRPAYSGLVTCISMH